jgi:ligand-binding SRPBCC domain-containing protein
MKYRHRFQVSAPLTCVSNFHSQAASIPKITPPPLSVRLHHVPDVLSEGD